MVGQSMSMGKFALETVDGGMPKLYENTVLLYYLALVKPRIIDGSWDVMLCKVTSLPCCEIFCLEAPLNVFILMSATCVVHHHHLLILLKPIVFSCCSYFYLQQCSN